MIDRQKEIQRLTEEKYLGLGYYNLADLMKCKAFNVVVTTNFDDLVHDALPYNGQSKRARVISRHLGSGTGLLGFMYFKKVLDKISKAMDEEIKTTVLINDINPKK